jgi:hypothetical protein
LGVEGARFAYPHTKERLKILDGELLGEYIIFVLLAQFEDQRKACVNDHSYTLAVLEIE